MKKVPAEEYLEKAKRLTKEEAEQLFARMRGKLERRLENSKLSPLEAAALQLELEAEQLREWRERWAEISDREKKARKKKD
ncbi:MAG: hypothetical protein HZC24_02560 [Rhodocyclales bacterium]|nr:hypothetical protein [Rhodocyclales bacterium]